MRLLLTLLVVFLAAMTVWLVLIRVSRRNPDRRLRRDGEEEMKQTAPSPAGRDAEERNFFQQGRRGARSKVTLPGVTKLIFVTTQISALAWVFTSYGIAVYSTVRLQQVYTMAELSEPVIRTILGVSFLKVLENIFEHNDSPVFGQSEKERPNGGEKL